MTEKMIISYADQIALQTSIIRDMTKDQFMPDVIIGVSRGGLPIGVIILIQSSFHSKDH
jgi:hypoxanthine phosphoribosyltransferase